MEFERMPGFHKLTSLWRIDYRAIAKEPILTMTADEETKELADRIVGKKIQKTYPDLVPLIFEGKASFSGNAVKGLFRHLIAAQLTAAGIPVCVQDVKAPEGVPEGRRRQCKPPDLCFVRNWFGTASRQGALHFSFLLSTQPYEEVISKVPIPMIALSDENMGLYILAGILLCIYAIMPINSEQHEEVPVYLYHNEYTLIQEQLVDL